MGLSLKNRERKPEFSKKKKKKWSKNIVNEKV